MRKQRNLPDFNKPGTLIAGLPAILGFEPEQSLVLVTLALHQLGAVLRVDLDDGLPERLADLAGVVAAGGADAVVAVVVDADAAFRPDEVYLPVLADLADALADLGVQVVTGVIVDRVAAGGRWRCADGCGRRGRVDDPRLSPLAVAAVVEGRRLYPRRTDLAATVEIADPDRTAELEPLLAAAAEAAGAERRTAPQACARREVEAAIELAQRLQSGRPLDDERLVAVGQSLTNIAVRDVLYGLAVGELADAAEELWETFARVLPGPWRVEALGLLAFSAYARGDGPLAGIALEAALRANPVHRMSVMLDSAMRGGLRPEDIRSLSRASYRQAAQIGVTLPQQVPDRRAG